MKMDKVEKGVVVLTVLFTVAVSGLIVWGLWDYEPAKVMSPCQCRVRGGCGMTWRPSGGVYGDGTREEDYDEYGRYRGKRDVPEECR